MHDIVGEDGCGFPGPRVGRVLPLHRQGHVLVGSEEGRLADSGGNCLPPEEERDGTAFRGVEGGGGSVDHRPARLGIGRERGSKDDINTGPAKSERSSKKIEHWTVVDECSVVPGAARVGAGGGFILCLP